MKRQIIKYKKYVPFASGLIFIAFVNIVPPDNTISFVFFYLILAICLFSIISMFTKPDAGLRYSLSLIIILLLKQIKQLNFVNIVIILAINIIFETYFRKTKQS